MLSFPCRNAPCKRWGLGATFHSQRFCQGRGSSLASNNLRCSSQPSAFPAHKGSHPLLCTAVPPGWRSETILLCTPLINPPSSVEWEQTVHTVFPPCWQGSCMHGVPAQHTSAPLLIKSLCVLPLLHLSRKSRGYCSHRQPRPSSSTRPRPEAIWIHKVVGENQAIDAMHTASGTLIAAAANANWASATEGERYYLHLDMVEEEGCG